MRGMCDHGADFAETGNGETFAGHGDKFIFDADAVVSSHFMGARTEKSRKSKIGKSNHRGRIFWRHAEDGYIAHCVIRAVIFRRRGEQHLKTRDRSADFEIIPSLWLRADKIDVFGWCKQLRKRRSVEMISVVQSGERNDVSWIADSQPISQCEMRVDGVQGVPDGIAERIFRHNA